MADGTLKVGTITTSSGSGTITLGQSGETIALGSGATLGSGMGKVLQVIQTVLTTVTSTTSTSHVDISGLSLSITPSSTSSKIFVLVDMALSESTSNGLVSWNLVRNSTTLAAGTEAGYSTNQTGAVISELGTAGNGLLKQSTQYLDSPSTTSATTYKIQWRTSAGSTVYLNRRATDTYMSVSSMITAMEIAG